jgi:UDP-N-acetylglucosamine 2-epimerase (non-hydrolysing)
MQKILFIFGTRPEAIKMAPLIKAFQNNSLFRVKVCVTAQHRSMLDQVLEFFEITPDYDLNLMQPNQSLFDITAIGLKSLEKVLDEFSADLIFVQGDTTSAFIGALAGFYRKIKVAHIEAGLRSDNKYSPFPEEINRKLAGHIADFHFAPTDKAVHNLKNEGITENVWQVGNTVIDALFFGLNLIEKEDQNKYLDCFAGIDFNKRIILVTGHRRESFGEPFENICNALKEIANKYSDVEIVYPVHLNPNIRKIVNKLLVNISNIHLIEPLSYPYLIWLMSKSYLIMTDSGGIQEEGPSLAKPVLVLREVTERKEGITAGTAKLVGTDKNKIIQEAIALLDKSDEYEKMAKAVNPYGDGTTSQQILNICIKLLNSSFN